MVFPGASASPLVFNTGFRFDVLVHQVEEIDRSLCCLPFPFYNTSPAQESHKDVGPKIHLANLFAARLITALQQLIEGLTHLHSWLGR